MTLIATVGSALANSYATVAEADAYFLTRVNSSAWTGADAVKEAALITATAFLNERDWKGYRATQGQRLAWPRVQVVDADGYAIDAGTIPRGLKEAVFEEALGLLATPARFSESALSQFESLSVGPISLVLRHAGLDPTRMQPQTRLLIGRWLASGGGVGVRVQRG